MHLLQKSLWQLLSLSSVFSWFVCRDGAPEVTGPGCGDRVWSLSMVLTIKRTGWIRAGSLLRQVWPANNECSLALLVKVRLILEPLYSLFFSLLSCFLLSDLQILFHWRKISLILDNLSVIVSNFVHVSL